MNKDRLSSSFNSDKARAAFTKKGGKVADVSAKSKALGKKHSSLVGYKGTRHLPVHPIHRGEKKDE